MLFFRKRKPPICLPNDFTVAGHTGCMNTPANSLEAIAKAVEVGADIVEFDLHFDKNGSPVLSHDEPKGGEVTLDEAFKKISEYDTLLANVDVKSTAFLEKVVPLAEKHGIADRIFYTGIFEADVDTVREKCPNVPYYLNYAVDKNTDTEYINSLVNKVRDCGAVGINCRHKTVTKELVDAFHRNGLLVSVWTVNRSHDMRNALAFAPDNITTKEPYKLRVIIKKILKSGDN